jgi:hypothetical protein
MKSLLRIMKFTALLAALTGCSHKPPPPPPTVADLHFPVAVLYSTASSILYKDATDLGVIHMNLLIGSTQPPVLIDSDFNIYTMEKLASTHGGLWLMTHPSGSTEVTFELKRSPNSGLQAALDAMRAQLDTQTWRDDLDKKRKTLASQKTLTGMMDVLKDPDQ